MPVPAAPAPAEPAQGASAAPLEPQSAPLHEDEEEDEDHAAREEELKRINEELSKADDRYAAPRLVSCCASVCTQEEERTTGAK